MLLKVLPLTHILTAVDASHAYDCLTSECAAPSKPRRVGCRQIPKRQTPSIES